jgi:hypothetical protein
MDETATTTLPFFGRLSSAAGAVRLAKCPRAWGANRAVLQSGFLLTFLVHRLFEIAGLRTGQAPVHQAGRG